MWPVCTRFREFHPGTRKVCVRYVLDVAALTTSHLQTLTLIENMYIGRAIRLCDCVNICNIVFIRYSYVRSILYRSIMFAIHSNSHFSALDIIIPFFNGFLMCLVVLDQTIRADWRGRRWFCHRQILGDVEIETWRRNVEHLQMWMFQNSPSLRSKTHLWPHADLRCPSFSVLGLNSWHGSHFAKALIFSDILRPRWVQRSPFPRRFVTLWMRITDSHRTL